jgi:hypothetical protein
MSDQHSLYVVEGINHHCTSIPEADLENTDAVSAPPRLADRGMIIAEFEKVAGDGQGARYFRYAFDSWDIC